MSNEPGSEIESGRRLWPWVVLIVLLLVVGGDQVYRWVVHSQVQREINALRREGYPVGVAELQAWHRQVPDQENAALRIMEAADYLALAPNTFNDRWPARAEELGPDERDAFREILTNNAPALEAVHLAAQLKQSRFPIDYSRGPNTSLAHLAKVKSLAQLLRAEALLRSEEGQPDLAVKSIQDGVALARALDTEPLLISQLVRIACLSISCSSLERLLTQHALTDAQLTALAETFRGAREASSTAFASGFAGEITLGVFCFTSPPAEVLRFMNPEAPVSPWAQVVFGLYAWTGLRDRDFLSYLRLMHGMLDTTKVPFPARLTRAQENADQVRRQTEHHRLLIFSRMLLPALFQATQKAAELEARLRCAEAALLVEQHRVKNRSTVAEALTQVTKAEPTSPLTDPMDGALLRCRTLEPGYVIYSVGPDGTDDGGTEKEPSGSGVRQLPPFKSDGANEDQPRSRTRGKQAYDITFIVER